MSLRIWMIFGFFERVDPGLKPSLQEAQPARSPAYKVLKETQVSKNRPVLAIIYLTTVFLVVDKNEITDLISKTNQELVGSVKQYQESLPEWVQDRIPTDLWGTQNSDYETQPLIQQSSWPNELPHSDFNQPISDQPQNLQISSLQAQQALNSARPTSLSQTVLQIQKDYDVVLHETRDNGVPMLEISDHPEPNPYAEETMIGLGGTLPEGEINDHFENPQNLELASAATPAEPDNLKDASFQNSFEETSSPFEHEESSQTAQGFSNSGVPLVSQTRVENDELGNPIVDSPQQILDLSGSNRQNLYAESSAEMTSSQVSEISVMQFRQQVYDLIQPILPVSSENFPTQGQLRPTNSSLLVLVTSSRENYAQRMAIRNTWASNHTNVYFLVGNSYPAIKNFDLGSPDFSGNLASDSSNIQKRSDEDLVTIQNALNEIQKELSANPDSSVLINSNLQPHYQKIQQITENDTQHKLQQEQASQQILEEMNTYQDIILLDMVDSPQNLTLKVVKGLTFATTQANQHNIKFHFITKIGDDAFLKIGGLTSYGSLGYFWNE